MAADEFLLGLPVVDVCLVVSPVFVAVVFAPVVVLWPPPARILAPLLSAIELFWFVGAADG